MMGLDLEGVKMFVLDLGLSVLLALLVGVLFDRRERIGWFAVGVGCFVLACVAVLVGGNVFASFRAVVWVLVAIVLACCIVALKAVAGRRAKSG